MADVIGSVAYEGAVELNTQRARDEMGRFTSQSRTSFERLLADLPGVFSAGMNSSISVLRRGMDTAARAGGDTFTERMSAAIASIPGNIGAALASGMISVSTAAARSAGESLSSTFARTVQQAAPAWRAAFSASMTQAGGKGVQSLQESARAGLSNFSTTFREAGTKAATALGTAVGNGINSIAGPLRSVATQAQSILQTGLQRAGELGTRALSFATERIVPALTSVASRAATSLQSGMQRAGEAASRMLETPFRDRLASGLKIALGAAAIAGGVALTAAAVKVGAQAVTGLVNAVRKGLSALGNMLSNAMRAAGGALVSAAAAIGKGAAQAMGDALKLGVNVAGAAIAGILGTSLTRGFGRLRAIDNAEAALRGFNATADHVPEIMDAANNAVLGTAFGLDEAATAAAQFAAAGVPISDMEARLSSLANSAAGAGGDFADMADIFSTVAARGNVTGVELQRLTSRGVSGLTALAEHFGITTEEVQAMVSAGEVSFEDFADAMDAAMGTAAIEQASTFTGLMANAGAAMGRFGAVMQKPFFEATKTVMPGIINLFNQFQTVVEPLADLIAARLAPAAERLSNVLMGIELAPANTSIKEFTGTLAALAPFIGGLVAAFAGPLLSSIPVVGSLFAGLTGPVGILAGALIALFAVKPDTLIAGFDNIASSLPGILDNIVTAALELIPRLASNFASNAPVLINGVANIFLQVVQAAAQILPTLIPVAIQAIVSLVTALIGAAPMLIEAGLQLLMGLADGIINALPVLVEAIPQIIDALITGIVDILPMLIITGVDIILALVDGIVTAIPQLIVAVIDAIPEIVVALIAAIPLLATASIELFLGLVLGLAQALPEIIDAVIAMVPALGAALLQALPEILESSRQLFMGILDGLGIAMPDIEEGLGGIMEVFAAVWEFMQAAWESVGQPIFDAIVAAIEFLMPVFQAGWENMQVIFSTAWEIIQEVFGTVWDGIVLGLETGMSVLTGLFEAGTAILQGDWSSAWDAIKNVFDTVWQALLQNGQNLINSLSNIISSVVSGISNLWTNAWNGIRNFFTNIWQAIVNAGRNFMNSVKNTFQNVMNFIREIPSRISQVFSNLGNLLLGSGRALVNGFLNGIKNAWSSITSFVSNGLQSIRNLFPFSPAKEGPFSGSGWVDRSGVSLGNAFTEGIVSSLGAGQGVIASSLSSIADDFNALDGFDAYGTGSDIANALADGLLNGKSSVEYAAAEIAAASQAAMDIPGMNIGPTSRGFGSPAGVAAPSASQAVATPVAGAAPGGLADGQPIHLTIADKDGVIFAAFETQVDNALGAGSRGRLQSRLGVSR